MLIIEGTDGIGKTILARRLEEELQKHGPWIYSHLSKPPATWEYPQSYLPHIMTHKIQDRFHMSSVVYDIARGDKPLLLPEQYRLVDAYCRLHGAFTVVLTATEKIVANVDCSTQLYSEIVHQDVNKMYMELVAADTSFMPKDYLTLLPQYKVDWDLSYHRTDPTKFPAEDENLIKKILARYMERINAL